MNPVYRAKPAVWMKPIPFFGGRLQTVNLDGNVYEIKKHKMNGLHLQQFHYPLLDMDSFPKENVLRSEEQKQPRLTKGRGNGTTCQAHTKKNIASILRGGAIAEL